MTTNLPESCYETQYLVGKFDQQVTQNNQKNVPFWVSFETKDLNKAVEFVNEQKAKFVTESKSLRILKKSTLIQYDII